MVLKGLKSPSSDLEDEAEMYLRKCSMRQSKRDNEKSRKLPQQAYENPNTDRAPSPLPPSPFKSGRRTKARAGTVVEVVNPPSPHSTDDPYPVPAPPPRSPAFSSPAFSRTLALSLNLMSPTGYTISGGRKAYSPEPNVFDFQSVQRAISNDSSQGELTGSPRSPRADSPASPLAWELTTGGAQSGEEANSAGKESSRVKQFLFHRDRDRTRKAQLLYHAVYEGADSVHDTELGTPMQSDCQRGYDSGTCSGRRSGQRNSRSHSRSAGRNRSGGDKYLRIDLETDIRAGTSGLAYTPSVNSQRSPLTRSGSSRGSQGRLQRPSPQAQHTPLGFVPTPTVPIRSPTAASASATVEEGVATSPFGSNSPYYRALTLGNHALSPAAVHAHLSPSPRSSAHSELPPKARRSSSVSSTSSSGSLSSTPSSYSDTDAVSPTAYESQFPALPQVPRTQSSSSILPAGSFLLKRGPSSGIAVEPESAAEAAVEVTSTAKPESPCVVPGPTYSSEEICAMFHRALCGSEAMEDQHRNVRNNDAARAFRAWDDADSDSEDSDSDEGSHSSASDSSSIDSRTAAQVATLQEQVRRIGDVDAACASLMAKCEYIYDTLKRPPTRRFDALWLSGMIQPSVRPEGCCAVHADQELSLQALFACGLVHGGLICQLVQALQYEDYRFESVRLPLLYALYTAPIPAIGSTVKDTIPLYCLRSRVAAALEHACMERQQRCAALAALATRYEMDVNYISKVGYSELCLATDCGSPAEDCAVDGVVLRSLATGCDLTAVIGGENERPTYRTRDSEGGLIELLKFIVAQEVQSALEQLGAQEREAHTWSEETKAASVAAPLGHGSASASPRTPAGASSSSKASVTPDVFITRSYSILHSVTAAYNHLFRCYTQKLGCASESIEQPAQLEQLLQCLDGLLAWAKVLCNLRGAQSDTLPSTPSALDTICERILQCTAKHWTAQVNFAQDIAYMLQSEMVLAIYAPASMSEGGCKPPSYSWAYQQQCKAGSAGVLPPLSLLRSGSTRSADIAAVVLKRLLQRVSCAHTKVASQAIQSLQNPVIMVRYFLPRMSTAMVSYIFGTEVGRITFLSGVGWDNDQREDCLNLLVDKLRECREIHTSPGPASQQLQASSAQLLDTTLELLQVIEDAE